MFSWHLHHLGSALPVICSLIVIEGLLSVDNALVIGAMVSRLPRDQQKLALRLGILGAYVFRGLSLALVSFIIANPWLKLVGAAYLLYLMASHLSQGEDPSEQAAVIASAGERASKQDLWLTVLQVEVMDLALSLDNVVAAVALDKRLWVVCTGVFIGILALRFLAGWCVRWMERFPTLKSTAFLLIGFVGVLLSAEVICEMNHVRFHVTAREKFVAIAAIVALSLVYDRSAGLRRFLRPWVVAGSWVMRVLDRIFYLVFWPAIKLVGGVRRVFTHRPKEA